MAQVRRWLVFCAYIALCYGSDSFDNILSNVNPCEEACTESYSPHTNPSVGENVACARGCRFFSISEYVMDDHPDHGNTVDGSDAHPVRSTCYDACVEAYNSTSRQTSACRFGCESQEIKTEEAKQEKQKSENEGPSIHLLSPLLQVRSVYSSFVGAVHVVRSSLITYFMRDDDSIVAVESEPQIMMEVMPEAREAGSLLESKLQGRQMRGPMEDNSVVQCVSQRLGVPPYLLVASVLVLVLFTIYIIFAVCSTATPSKIKSRGGLSVQADPLPLPVKLVRPEDLTRLSLMEEEDMEAAPLPLKVKLPNTTDI